MTGVLRIVLAEDSYLVREGVLRLIETAPDLQVIVACGSLGALLQAVHEERPDVVVTDVRMPPCGTDEGIQAADELRASHPGVGVVVLSQHDEPEYVLRLLKHGSAGRAYLLKDSLADSMQLTTAIREVASGGSVIDPKVVESLVAARTRDQRSALAGVTPRERDVLTQMAQGRNNDGIARALHLSVRVVEKHINSLFAKFGLAELPDVHRRVAAVLIYLAEADP
jgi:DNA-binding NarL/FixJ family response regulator